MAAKTPKPTIVLGQAQGGRPRAETTMSIHAQQSERPLQGALYVPIEQLTPDPEQPRRAFPSVSLEELAASLRDYGVLQPLVVRQSGALDDGRNRYTIIAGGRRYLAAQLAGLTRVPVLVREGDGIRLRVLQLIENLQREELSPVDEARAYRELMELERLTIRDVAGLIHRSRGYVSERLDLVKSEEVASAVQAGRVTASAAAVVAREKDPAARRALLTEVEHHRLQRKDVERLRREQRSATQGGVATLREVARDLGADEQQIAAAAAARRDDPDLSAPEALVLAMHASGMALEKIAEPTAVATPSLKEMIPDAQTAEVVLRVLEWARVAGLTRVDDLYRVVRAEWDRRLAL